MRGGITRRATPKPKTPPAPERKMHRVTPEQARRILNSSAKPSSMRKLSEDEIRRVAGGSAGGRRVLDPEAPMGGLKRQVVEKKKQITVGKME